MTRRKQVSKRRWKARAEAGKWIPLMVVIALDPIFDLTEKWDLHPHDHRFMKLRRSAEVTS